MDLNIRVQVNLLQWVQRIIADLDPNAAKALYHFLQTSHLQQYLAYRKPPTVLSRGKHQFYQEMLRRWNHYRIFEPESESTIRKDALWYNSNIGPGKTFLHWRNWQDKGVETVGDICHESEDRLLSHKEISQKFNLTCTQHQEQYPNSMAQGLYQGLAGSGE